MNDQPRHHQSHQHNADNNADDRQHRAAMRMRNAHSATVTSTGSRTQGANGASLPPKVPSGLCHYRGYLQKHQIIAMNELSAISVTKISGKFRRTAA